MQDILRKLGIESTNPGGFGGEWLGSGDRIDSVSPIDGKAIASVNQVSEADYDQIATRAHEAFLKWRTIPAPQRGETIRQLGNALREFKVELGALVTWEMGKSLHRVDFKEFFRYEGIHIFSDLSTKF